MKFLRLNKNIELLKNTLNYSKLTATHLEQFNGNERAAYGKLISLFKDMTFLYQEVTFLCKDETFLCKEVTFLCKDETFLCKEVTFLCKDETFLCTEVTFLCKDETFLYKDRTSLNQDVIFLNQDEIFLYGNLTFLYRNLWPHCKVSLKAMRDRQGLCGFGALNYFVKSISSSSV